MTSRARPGISKGLLAQLIALVRADEAGSVGDETEMVDPWRHRSGSGCRAGPGSTRRWSGHPVRPEEGIAALPRAFNAPALDCCLCGQLKLQGAARSIEPQSRFLGSGGGQLMRNRFPRNCRIQLGSLENVVLLTGGPKVRIHLPPAASLRTFSLSAEDAGF